MRQQGTRTRWTPLAQAPVLMLALVLAAGLGGLTASAQQDSADEKSAEPKPEDLMLQTKDGVELHATYYASGRGKDTVPIILLHGYKGNRKDFDGLAKYLQAAGYAVIVPDLRGHGASTSRMGQDRKLDADLFGRADYDAMWQRGGDLETVKQFLRTRNNEGKLNIERLGVIGAEMGAVVGFIWAVADWSYPPLAGVKQGQDVKAVGMISPEFSFKTLNLTQAMRHPAVRDSLSFYIVMGADDSKAVREARRIYSSLERLKKPPEDPADRELFWDETIRTRLQGTQILTEESLNLKEQIRKFVELRLARPSYPWKLRESPF